MRSTLAPRRIRLTLTEVHETQARRVNGEALVLYYHVSIPDTATLERILPRLGLGLGRLSPESSENAGRSQQSRHHRGQRG